MGEVIRYSVVASHSSAKQSPSVLEIGLGCALAMTGRTKNASQRSNRGAWRQATACAERSRSARAKRLRQKTPKTTFVFGASKQPVRVNRPAISFFYPDYYCRPRNYTESCGFGVSHCGHSKTARGLYHRSGIAPCPEGIYSIVKNYTTDKKVSRRF